MFWHPNKIKKAISEAIAQLAIEKGEEFASIIERIVQINFENGRVKWFLEHHATMQPKDYVWRVADYYERLSTYLHALQIEKQETLWVELHTKLYQWAGWYLQPLYLDYVEDSANQTLMEIIRSFFPYDTEFAPWARKILRHMCLRLIQSNHLLADYSEEEDDSLSETDQWLKNKTTSTRRELEEGIERQELYWAIEQLSEKRKLFIRLYYFEEVLLPEIAIIMNMQTNSVYKLHFDSLKSLRKILSDQ